MHFLSEFYKFIVKMMPILKIFKLYVFSIFKTKIYYFKRYLFKLLKNILFKHVFKVNQ